MLFLKKKKTVSLVRFRSGQLKKLAYEPDSHNMTAWHRSGARKAYHAVTQEDYDNIVNSAEPDFYYFNYINEESPRKSPVRKWLIICALILVMLAVWVFEAA